MKGDQQEDHDNVFFKNIGRDKDGKNYYIRMFVAKGGETIYEDGKPNEKATKDDIVFDKNTVWCAKSESQLHKDGAIRISVDETPRDIKEKFKKTNIIVLEAKAKDKTISESCMDKTISESCIFYGGHHSKITTQPSPSPQVYSAEKILPLQHFTNLSQTCAW